MQKETKVQMHLKEIENKLSMAQSPISLGFRVMDSREDIVGLAEEIMISAQKIKEILTDVEVESAKEEKNLEKSRSAFAASEKIKAGLSENENKHSEEPEYQTMDDSVKSFVKMEQKIKERNTIEILKLKYLNIILNFLIYEFCLIFSFFCVIFGKIAGNTQIYALR